MPYVNISGHLILEFNQQFLAYDAPNTWRPATTSWLLGVAVAESQPLSFARPESSTRSPRLPWEECFHILDAQQKFQQLLPGLLETKFGGGLHLGDATNGPLVTQTGTPPKNPRDNTASKPAWDGHPVVQTKFMAVGILEIPKSSEHLSTNLFS